MSELNLKRLIEEKIRELLIEEVGRIDISSIAQSIAERAVDDEIGDFEDAATDYIFEQTSDWQGKFGADDTMKELIDETFF